MLRFRALLTPLALLVAAPAGAQCTTSWAAAVSGNWNDPLRWTAGVPDAADVACIDADGSYVVTLNVNAAVGALVLGRASGTQTQTLLVSSNTLAMGVNSVINARGALDWRASTISTGGATLTNGGRIDINGSSLKQLGGNTTIRNEALATFAGTGTLRFNGPASAFVNAAAGTFDAQGDGDFTVLSGGNSFTNDGLYVKTGPGLSFVSATAGGLAFYNNGAVRAQAGTVVFEGDGTHTDGVFTAEAGAAVHFNLGTHTVVGTLSGDPTGAVFMDEGARLQGTGATLDFGGSGFEWRAGVMAGTFTNAGRLRLTASGLKQLVGGRVLTNRSLIEMSGTGTLRFDGPGTELVNAAGATFDLQSDAGFTALNHGNAFTNDGLLRKSGGLGASVVSRSDLAFSLAFLNDGAVSAASGTVDFDGPLTNEPSGLLQGTATINTAGATVTDNGTTGPGTSPGALSWVGPYAPRVGARLAVELGGPEPGTGHDQLVVEGDAVLGGILKVSFVNGFTPGVGDAFTVLTATGVSGRFAAVEEPAGSAVSVAYGPTDVVVTRVVNEVVVATLAPNTGPPDGPVVVPATGGPVRYRLRLQNTTGQQQTVQYWIEGLLPSGAVYQGRPLVGPTPQTLSANQTVGPVSLTQPVPASIPAGVYALRLRVGTYPNVVIDEDAFVVQKLAPTALGDAPVTAEAPDGASAAASAAYALHAAHPNPFATRATLRYDLPEAGAVRLTVYDLLGRRVAVLVDGEAEAGRHTAVLDGRSLASGTYVVRLVVGAQAFAQRVTLVR